MHLRCLVLLTSLASLAAGLLLGHRQLKHLYRKSPYGLRPVYPGKVYHPLLSYYSGHHRRVYPPAVNPRLYRVYGPHYLPSHGPHHRHGRDTDLLQLPLSGDDPEDQPERPGQAQLVSPEPDFHTCHDQQVHRVRRWADQQPTTGSEPVVMATEEPTPEPEPAATESEDASPELMVTVVPTSTRPAPTQAAI